MTTHEHYMFKGMKLQAKDSILLYFGCETCDETLNVERCQAVTQKQDQCHNAAQRGRSYCWHHRRRRGQRV